MQSQNIVAMDIPLLTRIMEECREGVDSDAELHFLLTYLIQQQLAKGEVLTMDDYADIMGYKERYALVCDTLKAE